MKKEYNRKKVKRKCEHKKIKKNYPFGKKSKPLMKCKICKKLLKPKDLK